MSIGPELLLIGAVTAVGVLHTMVPDHWVPIALIARQRGWSKAETARAAIQAGTGHVLSTLLIAIVVWTAGVAAAREFGSLVDTVASLGLVALGGWIAVAGWRELRGHAGHGHSHAHPFARDADDGIHGPELQRIGTDHGELALSIFEAGVPPHFRLTGAHADEVKLETQRADGARQVFAFADRGTHWESLDEIPEPHSFEVMISIDHGGHRHVFATEFAEHDHGHHRDHVHDHDDPDPAADPLYAPLRGDVALLTRHRHRHRHGRGLPHAHWHDHRPETAHVLSVISDADPLPHEHRHKTSARTALLLILGSSPMVEGIPAFFAAGKYGVGLIVVMSLAFALSTIATYVVFCVYASAGLGRLGFGALERYGEVLSGGVIVLVGVVFWLWPVL